MSVFTKNDWAVLFLAVQECHERWRDLFGTGIKQIFMGSRVHRTNDVGGKRVGTAALVLNRT